MFRGLRERRGDGPAVTPEGEGGAPAAGWVSASRWSEESTQHRVSWVGYRQGGGVLLLHCVYRTGDGSASHDYMELVGLCRARPDTGRQSKLTK